MTRYTISLSIEYPSVSEYFVAKLMKELILLKVIKPWLIDINYNENRDNLYELLIIFSLFYD